MAVTLKGPELSSYLHCCSSG